MSSDPYIGEIGIVAFAYAPAGWALCDGSLRLRQDKDFEALFSLIGTTYGVGDGRTTFALPDLRGRLPLGVGQGPGLSPVGLGGGRGAEQISLSTENMPSHTHEARFQGAVNRPPVYSGGGSLSSPNGQAVLANPMGESGVLLPAFAPAARANDALAPLPVDGVVTVFPSGAGLPVDVCNPALGLNFIIAYLGIYPPRS